MSHRTHVRCTDGMVHDVRVWRTATAACGVVVFDPPPGVNLRGLGFRVVSAAYAADGTGPTTNAPVDCMACVAGLDRTPYAVLCDDHGQQFLTQRGYDLQMRSGSRPWMCPKCGEMAHWDDDEYEAALGEEGDECQA